MKTIEQDWQDFRSHVYPNVSETSEQVRQLKACWFSAHLNCLSAMYKVGGEAVTEEQGADMLAALFKEADGFVNNYIKQEFKRQDLT